MMNHLQLQFNVEALHKLLVVLFSFEAKGGGGRGLLYAGNIFPTGCGTGWNALSTGYHPLFQSNTRAQRKSHALLLIIIIILPNLNTPLDASPY